MSPSFPSSAYSSKSWVPEPLVTVRRYPSAEHSEEDYDRLTEAGITVYRATPSRTLAVVLRVPDSQVQDALAILPPAEPDLLKEPDQPAVCPSCGSERAQYPAPAARIASLAGVFVTALLAVYRRFEAAGVVFALTIWAMYLAKINSGLVCANCGGKWRAPRGALPEPEPEHEPGTQNPE
jgi:hypothetical protein